MNEVLLIIGMLLVTFAARYPLMVVVGRVELPDNVFRALRYVPVAVLTAITVPAFLMPQGTIDLNVNNAYLIGGLVAIIMAWRTKNLLATIVISMGIFLFWRLVVIG